MAKNTDRNDDFWTLSELVPKRTYIKKPESDISPVTVETGDEEGAGAPVPTVGSVRLRRQERAFRILPSIRS